jgi:peptidoglycan/LPS O-acetylase OafA/YrhL
MQYRKEVDGLRAVAVVPVILFHAGMPGVGGGFVGVDVFFVISGYLISTLLLDEADRGKLSILQFYERRARRILPALFLVMAVTILAACVLMTAGQLKELGYGVMGVALFCSNIVFWKRSSYFRAESAQNPLLHTWSLGIEEQYYVLFPLAVLFFWPRFRRLFVWAVIVTLAVSLGLAQWGSAAAPGAAFYLLPTRAWELLAGVAVTLIRRKGEVASRGTGDILAVLGLAMILFAVFAYRDTTPFPGIFAVPPVAGAALIIAFARPDNLVGRLLSMKPFVWIGLVSYSAYLWHQPLFAFARIWGVSESNLAVFLLLGAISVVLAYFTWKHVENPFRDRHRMSRAQIFAFAGAGSILVLGLGGLSYATNGGEFRYDAQQKAILAGYAAAEPEYVRMYRSEKCFLDEVSTVTTFAPECYRDIIGRPGASIVWGDSHGASLHMGLFEALGPVPKAQLTSAGCPPLLGFEMAGEPRCPRINQASFQIISRAVRPRVFLVVSWFTYYRRPHFAESLARSIQGLNKLGADVIVVGTLPQWRPTLPDFVVSQMRDGGLHSVPQMLDTSLLDQLRNADAAVRAVAKANGARFISMLDGQCHVGKCRAIVTERGKPALVAWDYGHLTLEGSRYDARLLLERLSRKTGD